MATVRAAPGFDPEAAGKALRGAMKGIGTDEDTIIRIVASHNNEQRQEIKKRYKTMFGRDLNDDLKSEISGHFLQAVLGLFMTPIEFDAEELRRAMKGAGTKETALVEILCTRSNREVQQLAEFYHKLYHRKLEADLESETSGNFRKLIISLSVGGRDENNSVDEQKAMKDAKEIFEAGEAHWGTDESAFNKILCMRSVPQLRATFAAYHKLTGHEIDQAITKETSGDLQDGYLGLVLSVKSKPAFFAYKLYHSMKGGGTDDDTLIRVIVSRSEIDLQDIKQEFRRKYGKSLSDFVKSDCSGDYKKTMLGLIKE